MDTKVGVRESEMSVFMICFCLVTVAEIHASVLTATWISRDPTLNDWDVADFIIDFSASCSRPEVNMSRKTEAASKSL